MVVHVIVPNGMYYVYELYLCYCMKKLTIVLQLTHIKIGDFPGNVVLPAKMFQSREKVRRLFTLFGKGMRIDVSAS